MWGQRETRHGAGLGHDAVTAPLVSFQKVRLVAWPLMPPSGIGTLLVVPLHSRLHPDMGDAGQDHIGMRRLDPVVDRREVGRVGIES